MEELKIQYDIKTFKRLPSMLAPPELEKVHPLGKAPIVTVQKDDQSKPIVLAESALIIEYLIDHFGPNYIPTSFKEGQYNQVCGETDACLRYR